jgi:hypothetical protein
MADLINFAHDLFQDPIFLSPAAALDNGLRFEDTQEGTLNTPLMPPLLLPQTITTSLNQCFHGSGTQFLQQTEEYRQPYLPRARIRSSREYVSTTCFQRLTHNQDIQTRKPIGLAR